MTSSSLPLRRRDARERALELLYEADMKGCSVEDVLADLPLTPDPFSVALARGVAEHQERFDELTRRFLRRDWTFERMPLLDRLVLSLAMEELLTHTDVPVAVAIDEAVELAKQFSTDDSSKFVNGMLRNILPFLRP